MPGIFAIDWLGDGLLDTRLLVRPLCLRIPDILIPAMLAMRCVWRFRFFLGAVLFFVAVVLFFMPGMLCISCCASITKEAPRTRIIIDINRDPPLIFIVSPIDSIKNCAQTLMSETLRRSVRCAANSCGSIEGLNAEGAYKNVCRGSPTWRSMVMQLRNWDRRSQAVDRHWWRLSINILVGRVRLYCFA